MSGAKPTYTSGLGHHIPVALKDLLGSKGLHVVRRVGADAIREVIADVLCGKNLRDSTEMLTRRRLGLLNAATFIFFLRGVAASSKFLDHLHSVAADGLRTSRSREERWLLQWVVGLTGKGVQNVLRDSDAALDNYITRFSETTRLIANRCKEEYGAVAGKIRLVDGTEATVTWELLLNLFCTVGSQTLAVRGSEKSTYGKLFERLVLGAVLEMMGFDLVEYPPHKTDRVFWLSSTAGARESDATALVRRGQAMRFDIGFIGRGNPEITKDKLSRFERQLEIGRHKYYCATIIIVDRVGEKSRIAAQAGGIDASIVQMSMSYWPQQLARILREKVRLDCELCDLPTSEVGPYIRRMVSQVQVERYLAASQAKKPRQED